MGRSSSEDLGAKKSYQFAARCGPKYALITFARKLKLKLSFVVQFSSLRNDDSEAQRC